MNTPNKTRPDELLAHLERIVECASHLTTEELRALQKWEGEHVTGDGMYGTSDWPGWDQVFQRASH